MTRDKLVLREPFWGAMPAGTHTLAQTRVDWTAQLTATASPEPCGSGTAALRGTLGLWDAVERRATVWGSDENTKCEHGVGSCFA